MPIYEYKCAACSHRFERWEKLSAPAVQACPDCGHPSHRQIGAPALQFKGGGWYVTDYAKKGSASASEPAATSEPTSTAKTESKGETSGATKSESSGGGSKEGSSSDGSSKHAAA